MNTNDPRRNTPAEKGRNNDPDLRNDSAVQPGISTVSNSNYDGDNEGLTQTAKDDFMTGDEQGDQNADRSFEEE
jgi:hypothetical protein